MILTALAGFGLNFVKDLITDHGENLVTEGIKKVTGIDISKKELTQEEIAKIKECQLDIEKLDFEKLKEANRHEEHYIDLEVHDTQNARGATHLHSMQTDIAKKIYVQSSFMIPALLIMNVILVVMAEQLELEVSVVVAVSNLIGIALNNSYRERQSILEFLFGSSVGSKLKSLVKGK